MKRALQAAAILLIAACSAFAHRLDEYLQATLVSVERGRVQAQMTLTPGVAVFPALLRAMDTDGDGTVSANEQHAYAQSALQDLSLKIDGRILTPRLLSWKFPAVAEMREGRGEIKIEFASEFPPGGPNRRLIFENRHQGAISAYLVNSLVPRDPDIRIVAQHRNYSQSFYELDFAEATVRSGQSGADWLSGIPLPLGTAAILPFSLMVLFWSLRTRPVKPVRVRSR